MKYHWPSCELRESKEVPKAQSQIFSLSFKIFLVCFCFGAPWVLLGELYNFRPVNLIYVSGIVAGIIVSSIIKKHKKEYK